MIDKKTSYPELPHEAFSICMFHGQLLEQRAGIPLSPHFRGERSYEGGEKGGHRR
jgi:hypothetical protein